MTCWVEQVSKAASSKPGLKITKLCYRCLYTVAVFTAGSTQVAPSIRSKHDCASTPERTQTLNITVSTKSRGDTEVGKEQPRNLKKSVLGRSKSIKASAGFMRGQMQSGKTIRGLSIYCNIKQSHPSRCRSSFVSLRKRFSHDVRLIAMLKTLTPFRETETHPLACKCNYTRSTHSGLIILAHRH